MGELAELGGVSRRTVRYYVQAGLIPNPTGLGRGAHYRQEHLEQLLRVKAMQEQGMTLDGIRTALSRGEALSAPASILTLVPRSHWTRLELLPGVELLVSSERRLPPPRKLQELAEWCHRSFHDQEEEEDG